MKIEVVLISEFLGHFNKNLMLGVLKPPIILYTVFFADFFYLGVFSHKHWKVN